MLHAQRRGSGPPLLLVHGLGGGAQSFDPVLPALAASRELILVELPGHGRSPVLPGRQTTEAYADALSGFMDAQGLSGVDLVGSSFGARLVLELTRRGLGGACVALDPGGFWAGWERRFFETTIGASIRLVRLLRPLLPALAANPVSRSLLLAQLSARPWRLDGGVVARELQSFAATPVFDALVRELAHGPMQQGSAATPGPVTIAWGRQDRLCLPRQATRAMRAFPNATLRWLDRCGHFPQWDRPDATVRLILEAMEGQRAAPASAARSRRSRLPE